MREIRNVYIALVRNLLEDADGRITISMMKLLKERICLLLPGKWHHGWEMLGLAMTGRIAIAISLTLLQVTSSELLPLEHRELGTYSSLIFARIFLLSAPFIGPLVSLHKMAHYL